MIKVPNLDKINFTDIVLPVFKQFFERSKKVSNVKREERDSLLEATVGEIRSSSNGRYAVTFTKIDGVLPKGTAVTFSIEYWKGSADVRKGQVVLLGNLQKFAKGWRAFEARPFSLAEINQQ